MPICWRQHRMTALTEDLLDETTTHHDCDLPFPSAIDHSSTDSLDGVFEANPNLSLLQKQRRKLKADWEKVGEALPNMSFERYVHYWLLVSTRTFYFEMPGVKTHPPRDDRIVMCPFIDLFNHNDTGVRYLTSKIEIDAD